jgi:xanthine dehydrogenase iron-sulfur cluster and FAD-binding subunit A
MDALPEFRVLNPTTLADALAARAANPASKPLGGGTDLVVNMRRGIVAPPVLIDLNRVEGLSTIKADADMLEIGASVTLVALAEHPEVIRCYRKPRLASRDRPIATWGRSAAISASIRVVSITIRANGGATPIIIA